MPVYNEIPRKNAAAYTYMLQKLLPRGPAWTRRKDSVLTKVLAASAEELARLDELAHLLLKEVNPLSSFNAISDFERILGLPDECFDSSGGLQERREAVLYKLNDTGRNDIAYYQEQAAKLGYDVQIKNFLPFVCGKAICGDSKTASLGPPEVRYWLKIILEAAKVTYFRCGESMLPAQLGKYGGPADIACLIQRDKQAHILITVESA